MISVLYLSENFPFIKITFMPIYGYWWRVLMVHRTDLPSTSTRGRYRMPSWWDFHAIKRKVCPRPILIVAVVLRRCHARCTPNTTFSTSTLYDAPLIVTTMHRREQTIYLQFKKTKKNKKNPTRIYIYIKYKTV